jgi:hypothetical protein
MTTHSIREGVQGAIKTMEGIALVKVDVDVGTTANEEAVEATIATTAKEEAVEATIEANVGKVEQVGNETTATKEEREMMCKAFLEQIAAKGYSSNDILDEIGGEQLSFHTTKREEGSIADNVPNGEAEALKESPDVGALDDEVKEDESTNKDVQLHEDELEEPVEPPKEAKDTPFEQPGEHQHDTKRSAGTTSLREENWNDGSPHDDDDQRKEKRLEVG